MTSGSSNPCPQSRVAWVHIPLLAFIRCLTLARWPYLENRNTDHALPAWLGKGMQKRHRVLGLGLAHREAPLPLSALYPPAGQQPCSLWVCRGSHSAGANPRAINQPQAQADCRHWAPGTSPCLWVLFSPGNRLNSPTTPDRPRGKFNPKADFRARAALRPESVGQRQGVFP